MENALFTLVAIVLACGAVYKVKNRNNAALEPTIPVELPTKVGAVRRFSDGTVERGLCVEVRHGRRNLTGTVYRSYDRWARVRIFPNGKPYIKKEKNDRLRVLG